MGAEGEANDELEGRGCDLFVILLEDLELATSSSSYLRERRETS